MPAFHSFALFEILFVITHFGVILIFDGLQVVCLLQLLIGGVADYLLCYGVAVEFGGCCWVVFVVSEYLL